MSSKIKIALSSCLLGNAVRYDGAAKRNDYLIHALSDEFDLVAVCPEVMAGLGVPRAKLQLVKVGQDIRALGVGNAKRDVSTQLIKAADDFAAQHKDICGLILKSKSPSCGFNSARIFNQNDQLIAYGMGLFAQQMWNKKTGFPVCEDTQLCESAGLVTFCVGVREYARQASLC